MIIIIIRSLLLRKDGWRGEKILRSKIYKKEIAQLNSPKRCCFQEIGLAELFSWFKSYLLICFFLNTKQIYT